MCRMKPTPYRGSADVPESARRRGVGGAEQQWQARNFDFRL